MEFDERKVLKFDEKWFELRTSEIRWEVLVSILRKVFSLKKLGWNGKTKKTQAKSSFLSKIWSKLSLSPKLNGANEDHRVENTGLYRWW